MTMARSSNGALPQPGAYGFFGRDLEPVRVRRMPPTGLRRIWNAVISLPSTRSPSDELPREYYRFPPF
jgi:hypothetical protein